METSIIRRASMIGVILVLVMGATVFFIYAGFMGLLTVLAPPAAAAAAGGLCLLAAGLLMGLRAIGRSRRSRRSSETLQVALLAGMAQRRPILAMAGAAALGLVTAFLTTRH